jgi:multidrug efflux pump
VFYVVLRLLTGNRALKQHGEVPHIEAFAAPEAGGGGRAGVPAAPVDSNQP